MRLIIQRILGTLGSFALLVPGGFVQAAILYGAEAHEKTFTVTLAESSSHIEDWNVLGKGALGVFVSVEDASTNKPAAPEILFLPCIKGSRCVTLSAKEDAPIKGLLSFLRPAHTFSVDGESADTLSRTAAELCEHKKKGALPRYRITQEIVYEHEVARTTFAGSCVSGPGDNVSTPTFSVRGTIEN